MLPLRGCAAGPQGYPTLEEEGQRVLGGGAGTHGRHGEAAGLPRAESGDHLDDYVLKCEM